MSDEPIEDLLDDLDEAIADRLKNLSLQEHLEEISEIQKDLGLSGEDIIESICERAKILYKAERFEDANALLEEAKKCPVMSPKPYCFMGGLCLTRASREGENSPSYYEAMQYFQRALQLDPQYALAQYGLGLVDLRLNADPQSAQRKYRILMTLEPQLASHLKSEIDKFLTRKK